MDRKPALSPTAEAIVRRELSLMGADPDDLDRYMALAQAKATPIEPVVPDALSVAAPDGLGRFLLQPRPFRLSERIGERVRRPDHSIPALSAG